jgi:hypothetical protein
MRQVLVLLLAVSSCASVLISSNAVHSDFSTHDDNNAVLDDLLSTHDDTVPDLFTTAGRRVRQKRSAGGEDACMQIYTVPKRTVKCDPSDEVRDALAAIQDSLVDHAESIQGLGARIDEIDPEKEKQLPEEVRLSQLMVSDLSAHRLLICLLTADHHRLGRKICCLDLCNIVISLSTFKPSTLC